MQRTDENSSRPLAFITKWRRTLLCILLLAVVVIILTSAKPDKSSAASKTIRQSGTPSRWLSKLIGATALPRNDQLAALTPKAYAQLKFREADDENNNEPLKEGELLEHEEYWALRLTYPTGDFDPQWVREAIDEDRMVARAIPAGVRAKGSGNSPQTRSFAALTSTF